MKILQNKFVRSLPKVILFAVALCNFVWAYWQNLHMGGIAGVVIPWYSDKETSNIPIYLLIASMFLLIPKIWSYSAALGLSGFHSIKWIIIIVKFIYLGDQTFYEYLSHIQIYDNNPLTAFESQIVIATLIFSLSIYALIKELIAKPTKTLL